MIYRMTSATYYEVNDGVMFQKIFVNIENLH